VEKVTNKQTKKKTKNKTIVFCMYHRLVYQNIIFGLLKLHSQDTPLLQTLRMFYEKQRTPLCENGPGEANTWKE
jgi:hypothetical protein